MSLSSKAFPLVDGRAGQGSSVYSLCILFLAHSGLGSGVEMLRFLVSRAGPQAGRPDVRRRNGGEVMKLVSRRWETDNPRAVKYLAPAHPATFFDDDKGNRCPGRGGSIVVVARSGRPLWVRRHNPLASPGPDHTSTPTQRSPTGYLLRAEPRWPLEVWQTCPTLQSSVSSMTKRYR